MGSKGRKKRSRDVEVICLNCGKAWSQPEWERSRKFCSHDCAYRYRTGKRRKDWCRVICEECGKEYEVIPARASKTRFCSRSCASRSLGSAGREYPADQGARISAAKIQHGMCSSVAKGRGFEDRFADALTAAKVKFERQRRLGKYRVDFLLEPRLVIEIDGRSHAQTRQRDEDARRDNYVQKLGYTVVRITHYQIATDLNKWIGAIVALTS